MIKTNTKISMLAGMILMFLISGCSRDRELDNLDEVGETADLVVRSWGIDPGWADAAANGFNDAFLATDASGNTYYTVAMNTDQRDQMWTFALDIQAMQDVYVRTGSDYHRNLINDLTNGWMAQNPLPYDWDGWNDDIAWMGLTSARSHHITGNQQFIDHARSCFDFVWDRGWDTQYNGGGIWEEQPRHDVF